MNGEAHRSLQYPQSPPPPTPPSQSRRQLVSGDGRSSSSTPGPPDSSHCPCRVAVHHHRPPNLTSHCDSPPFGLAQAIPFVSRSSTFPRPGHDRHDTLLARRFLSCPPLVLFPLLSSILVHSHTNHASPQRRRNLEVSQIKITSMESCINVFDPHTFLGRRSPDRLDHFIMEGDFCINTRNVKVCAACPILVG